MDFQFSDKEEALRKEIREFVKQELPPGWIRNALAEESTDEAWAFTLSISKKLSAKGWLTMAWPKEYGGMGASLWEQLVFREEAGYWGIPGVTMGVGGVDWVGPSLISYGSEELKKTHLPMIASGEQDGVWCTGYSEPNAGSDFANIRTKAIKDGDEYVVNGQKIWTSAAHRSRWMWLAAVTAPEEPKKHKRISILIVDMKSPGLTVNPIINYAGYHFFNEVFFDDVRVPAENLVGEENRGWYQLMSSLAHERGSIAPGSCGLNKRMLDELVHYVKGTDLINNPEVRNKLADRAIEIEAQRVLVYQTIWKMSKGQVPFYEPARDKVFNDYIFERLSMTGLEILGLYSQMDPLSDDEKWKKLKGSFESMYWLFPGMSIAGGTDEIQKNIIAMFGLELPKAY